MALLDTAFRFLYFRWELQKFTKNADLQNGEHVWGAAPKWIGAIHTQKSDCGKGSLLSLWTLKMLVGTRRQQPSLMFHYGRQANWRLADWRLA